jgi:hypothetical protein
VRKKFGCALRLVLLLLPLLLLLSRDHEDLVVSLNEHLLLLGRKIAIINTR